MAIKTKETIKKSAGMMDLNALTAGLDRQSTLREQRQTKELEVATQTAAVNATARREAAVVNEQSFQSAEASRQQQLQVLGGINGQIEKANLAMQLSDSQNPLDRLNLYFLQQSDAGYTRQGNLNRMSYLQSAAQGLGVTEEIRQAGFADSIARTKALADAALAGDADQLKLLQIQEQQGAELIDAEVNAQQLRLGNLTASNAMMTQTIVNMTDEQVTTATQSAEQNGGSVNVSGVDLSLQQLKDRQLQIKERRYNERVLDTNNADITIANMTLEELQQLEPEALNAKGRRVEVGGVQIPHGRITQRIYELQDQEVGRVTQQYQLGNMQEDLLNTAQRRVIDTMEIPEIQQLIAMGGKDAQGRKFRLDDLKAVRDLKMENNAGMINDQVIGEQMGSPLTPVIESQDRIKALLPQAQPGTQLMSQLTQAQKTLFHAATLAGSEDPQAQRVAAALIQAADEQVQGAVQAEAARLSDGDKDLERAYLYQLQGQAVPQDLVYEAISTRVKKGDHVGRWLSGANSNLYVTTYRSELARLEADPMLRGSKEANQAAAESFALNALKGNIAANMDQELMMMQLQEPGHPLGGIMTSAQFAVTMRNADDAGARNYQSTTQASDEDMAKLRTGAVANPDFIAAQNSALYIELEKKRPGLGKAYVEWWSGEGRDSMVNRYIAGKTASVKGDFSALSEMSLVAPHMRDSMGFYATTLNQGQEMAYSNEIQRQHAEYISFGGNPQNKQLFLLEQTPNMTSQEKQIAMQQIIQPWLDVATQNGMSPPETTTFLETQLRTMDPPPGMAGSVLRKLLAGRDASLKVITDLVSANTGFSSDLTNAWAGQGAAREINSSANYGWWTQMQQNGVKPPRQNAGER